MRNLKIVDSDYQIKILSDVLRWRPSFCEGCIKRVACRVECEKRRDAIPYEPDKYLYVRVRAITADRANANGDCFELEELKKSYKTFIGKGVFKDHKSQNIEDAYGVVLDSRLVQEKDDAYIELLIAIDKKKDPDFARRVEDGFYRYVSMGCLVQETECSLCGNVFRVNDADTKICPHMDPKSELYCKGKIVGGKKVYELNRGITFVELSFVTNPADRTCEVFEILEKKVPTTFSFVIPDDLKKEGVKAEKIVETIVGKLLKKNLPFFVETEDYKIWGSWEFNFPDEMLDILAKKINLRISHIEKKK